MSWNESYPRMLRRNKAAGFAICHCLLKAFKRHRGGNGINAADITRISVALFVSERWVYHILIKYRLFYPAEKGYYPEPGWREMERMG